MLLQHVKALITHSGRDFYLVASEYFPISDDDDLPGYIYSHLSLQLEKVFCPTIVHVDQIPLQREGAQYHSSSSVQ